jgi:NADPH-dependent 7-cyano-7-deazaguanine reductase QueF
MFELVNPKILAWVFDISRKGGVHIEFFLSAQFKLKTFSIAY